jgi:WD40 repeat protein
VDIAYTGSRLAIGHIDEATSVLDAGSLTEQCSIRARIWRLVFTPDGTKLAARCVNNKLCIWLVASGKCMHTIDADNDAMALAASNKLVACNAHHAPSHIQLWDVTTGLGVRRLSGHTGIVYVLAFSADGTQLFSAEYSGAICVWASHSGERLASIDGIKYSGACLAVAPNFQQFASTQSTGVIHLLAFDGQHRMLYGHSAEVLALAYSPDGGVLVSMSRDVTMRAWAAGSGEMLAVVKLPTKWMSSMHFSPDGATLITSERDDGIFIWDARLPVREMRAFLAAALRPRSVAGRFLARDAARDVCRLIFSLLTLPRRAAAPVPC